MGEQELEKESLTQEAAENSASEAEVKEVSAENKNKIQVEISGLKDLKLSSILSFFTIHGCA